MSLDHETTIDENRTDLLEVLRVSDLLLTELCGECVLDQRTKQEILAGGIQYEINGRFLDWLIQSQPSTFKICLEKLRGDQQQHIANLLDGTPGERPLTKEKRQQIEKNIRHLSEVINVDTELLALLYSMGAISDMERQEISSEQVRQLKAMKLLQVILRKSDRTLYIFVDALRQTNQDQVISTLEKDIHGQTSLEELQIGHETLKRLQQAFISPSFTKQQRNNILQKIKLFRFPKVSITNCIFEDEYVEFYFVLEGTSRMEKSLLENEIVKFLGVDATFAGGIRVTQLKNKPTGERTHIGPGSPIKNINARDSTTTLGAFVSIEGKGNHVLSCGHDKTVGDILFNGNNERIGSTRAVAYCTEDGQSYDAALVNVDDINYATSVAFGGRQLHLAPTPVDPVKGTVVQRFPPRSMASQATIRHTDYNSFVHNIYGCFSVITDNREAFHYPGESGLVVTTMPSADLPERVHPIGMLFFREFVEKTDDGRGYYLSLAIPMVKNLEKLQEDEYCGAGQITFLRDA